MKKALSYKVLACAIAVAGVFTACEYRNWEKMHPYGQSSGPATPCPDTAGITVSYSLTIQPIIMAKCATSGCHTNGGTALNYNQFINVYNDACVNCGSLFMDRIKRPTSDPLHMPQGGPMLDSCDIKNINRWIWEGCPMN